MYLHLFNIPAAYFAVDFFFILSGFVLARAYEAKLRGKLTAGSFIERRLIRLYPVFFAGLSVGVIHALISATSHAAGANGNPPVAISFVMHALLLPNPLSSVPLFPLNPPAWSLFWELIVNGVFVVFLFRCSTRGLFVVCGIAAAAIVTYIAVHGGSQPLNGGGTWDTFALGPLRALFAFASGIVASRLLTAGPNQATNFLCWIPIALLLVLFLTPVPQGYVVLRDAVATVVLVPGIFVLAATLGANRSLQIAAPYLSDISYPFYAVHYPVMRIVVGMLNHLHQPNPWLALAVSIGASAVLGYLLLYLYDIPVRRWLSKRARMRMSAPSPVDASAGQSAH